MTSPGESDVRRRTRFSIAGLMGLVLVASLGFATLRIDPSICAGLMHLVTTGVLALAIVGVVCRGSAERAWWLGFALFGWGFLATADRYWGGGMRGMPTTAAFDFLWERIQAKSPALAGRSMPGPPTNYYDYLDVANCVWTV